MKLISVITPLMALFSAASAITVIHDATYDYGPTLLSTVTSSCSNGATTFSKYISFDKMPSYPYIGAAKPGDLDYDIECGSCYQLTYNEHSIKVTVISQTTEDGFRLSLTAFNELNNGPGSQVSHLSDAMDVEYTKVDEKYCGL